MGLTISKYLYQLFNKKELRVIIIGLDGAGKTTILYKMRFGELVPTIPTVGFNVETLDLNGARFTVWDIGGQDKIRRLWRHYYQNAQGVIFVVDSTDKDRISTAREELHALLTESELRNAILLVLANKQDLPNALKPSDLSDSLGLSELSNRRWRIQGTCAVDGSGLIEGLEWLSKEIE